MDTDLVIVLKSARRPWSRRRDPRHDGSRVHPRVRRHRGRRQRLAAPGRPDGDRRSGVGGRQHAAARRCRGLAQRRAVAGRGGHGDGRPARRQAQRPVRTGTEKLLRALGALGQHRRRWRRALLAVAMGSSKGHGGSSTSTASMASAASSPAGATADPFSVFGTITAGPVLPSNDLRVEVRDTSGRVLGASTVDANGRYQINGLNGAYAGPLLVTVFSTGGNVDYVDVATHAGKDLAAPLRAAAVRGNDTQLQVNVTAVTELAVRVLAPTDGKLPADSAAVTHANTALSRLLGLGDSDITASTASPVILQDGSVSGHSNRLRARAGAVVRCRIDRWRRRCRDVATAGPDRHLGNGLPVEGRRTGPAPAVRAVGPGVQRPARDESHGRPACRVEQGPRRERRHDRAGDAGRHADRHRQPWRRQDRQLVSGDKLRVTLSTDESTLVVGSPTWVSTSAATRSRLLIRPRRPTAGWCSSTRCSRPTMRLRARSASSA